MVEENELWTLYGFVSHSFDLYCDPKDYVAFVDVTKFIDWISSNIKN
mgnify:FL=1